MYSLNAYWIRAGCGCDSWHLFSVVLFSRVLGGRWFSLDFEGFWVHESLSFDSKKFIFFSFVISGCANGGCGCGFLPWADRITFLSLDACLEAGSFLTFLTCT